MSDLKNRCLLFYDYGLFAEVALRLARDFGRVLYYVPWKTSFCHSAPAHVGVGLAKNMERVDHFWDCVPEADIVVFGEIPDADAQKVVIEKFGKPVLGHRGAERLETDRWGTRQLQRDLGIAAPRTKVFSDLDSLVAYLQKTENKWVKLSTFRGDSETWHHENWHATSIYVDKFANRVGALKDRYEFLVEDHIEGIEIGYDGWHVRGAFPSSAYWGFEVKDRGYCYDEQTEVLTDNGWKFFKNLNGTDRIMTLDISDNRHYRMRFDAPVAYQAYYHDGKMLKVENRNVDLCVTPEHCLLVQTPRHRGRIRELVRACDLDLSRSFKMPFPKSASWRSGSTSKRPMQIGRHTVNYDDFACFMGLYLSEGCVRSDPRRNEVVVSQFKHTDAFDSVLNRLPFKFKRFSAGFYLNDKEVCDYLRQFGKAGDKFIPDEIKNACPQVIHAFLDHYCLGDGSFLDASKDLRGGNTKMLTSRKIYTKSKRMADDLQECFLKTGKQSLVRKHANRDIYVVAERPVHCKNIVRQGQATWIDYAGTVYCVTVPSGIIHVRRNGKSIWCGNCGKFSPYHEIPEPIRFINNKMAPILAREEAAGFCSFEFRLGKNRIPYLIDPCMRFASPPTEALMEGYANFSQIVWDAANGRMAAPECAGKFLAIALIHCAEALTNWVPVHIPGDIRRWVKIRNAAVIDGRLYHVPTDHEMPEVGAVVGIADTLEEAIQQVKDRAEQVKGYGLDIKIDSLDAAQEYIDEAKDYGIDF